MAKLSKEEQARREGMAYALRLAKEKGIDALEEDLKMRNAIDLPLRVSKADLDKFSDNVKYNTILYIKNLMAVTMHDEFGFGNKRINCLNLELMKIWLLNVPGLVSSLLNTTDKEQDRALIVHYIQLLLKTDLH